MTRHQCPIAKYIIKRIPAMEKYLVAFKPRPGHTCEYSCTVVAILMYDAVPSNLLTRAYHTVTQVSSSGKGKEAIAF